MRWWVGAALALAACGRRDFDPLADGGGASDGTAGCGHTFCDNFDRSTPPETGWDTITRTAAIGAGIEAGRWTVSVPADLEGSFLVKTFHVTSQIAVAFTLEYTTSQVNMNTEHDLVALEWVTPGTTCTTQGYNLVKDGTGPAGIQETYAGCGANVTDTFVALENTGRHRVEITVTTSPSAVQVRLDGSPVHDLPAAHPVPASDVTLRLGAVGDRNLSMPWVFRYDDLTVDVN